MHNALRPQHSTDPPHNDTPCRFPLLFHSIVGKDEREEQSPSWFNVQEAKLVLHYIMVCWLGVTWQTSTQTHTDA